MLSELDANFKWRQLFSGEIGDEAMDEARQLLEQLPPESPLRTRLTIELDEIRELRQRQRPSFGG